MNFIEALRSGKKFRRKGDEAWFDAAYFFEMYVPANAKWFMERFFPLLLDNDWEIQEPTVTVSKKQIDAALLEIVSWCKSHRRDWLGRLQISDAHEVFFRIYRMLGLEP